MEIVEKSSWMNLARTPTGLGEWRTATCKLSEDDNDKSLLNIYVDVRTSFYKYPSLPLICPILKETILYQTVYVHHLRHSDIRHADTSLFQRKDCVGIYCVAYVSCPTNFIFIYSSDLQRATVELVADSRAPLHAIPRY